MASSNHDGTWTLTHAEYQELKRASDELAALEAYGVDNWEGYGDAMQSLEEDN
ncbi:hypothetical protein [Streptomyces rochei]|uniref:hypothetical protein n=1 Tax=Streptomyces rochei TaxID=1928 RepID=UPI0036F7801F